MVIIESNIRYQISSEEIVKRGGSGLLARYNNSFYVALAKAFPEHDWLPWKFRAIPRNFWQDKEHVKKLLHYLETKLSIKSLEDW